MGMSMRGKEVLSLRSEYGKVFLTGPQKYRSVAYLLGQVHHLISVSDKIEKEKSIGVGMTVMEERL